MSESGQGMDGNQQEGAANFFIFATASIYSANFRHRKRNCGKSLVITGVNPVDLQD
jgi:hypothetical protein